MDTLAMYLNAAYAMNYHANQRARKGPVTPDRAAWARLAYGGCP